MAREVVVVSGVRTTIGTFGVSLKDIPPTELAAQVKRECLLRANVDGQDVRHAVFGHVGNNNKVPDTVTMDKSDVNKAALDQLNSERAIPIKVRQVKYLNNIVEQDHRAVKRVTWPMLGFKGFVALAS